MDGASLEESEDREVDEAEGRGESKGETAAEASESLAVVEVRVRRRAAFRGAVGGTAEEVEAMAGWRVLAVGAVRMMNRQAMTVFPWPGELARKRCVGRGEEGREIPNKGLEGRNKGQL